MNTLNLKKSRFLTLLLSIACALTMNAQIGGWNPELAKESEDALDAMIKDTPKLKAFYDEAYGYVVFPKITKAGFVIGGAGGNGVVYKNHEIVGTSKLKQGSFGLQAGGQQYSEVIFFENESAYDHFINGNLKFDGQASAVAIKQGASIDVAYKDGVSVFTKTGGGLMLEASVGGQHFSYKPIK